MILAPFFHYQRKGNIPVLSNLQIFVRCSKLKVSQFFCSKFKVSQSVLYYYNFFYARLSSNLQHVSRFHRSFCVKRMCQQFLLIRLQFFLFILQNCIYFFPSNMHNLSSFGTCQLVPKLAKTPMRRHFSFPFLASMTFFLSFLFNIQCHQLISHFPAHAFNPHIGGFNLTYLIGLAYRNLDNCL